MPGVSESFVQLDLPDQRVVTSLVQRTPNGIAALGLCVPLQLVSGIAQVFVFGFVLADIAFGMILDLWRFLILELAPPQSGLGGLLMLALSLRILFRLHAARGKVARIVILALVTLALMVIWATAPLHVFGPGSKQLAVLSHEDGDYVSFAAEH